MTSVRRTSFDPLDRSTSVRKSMVEDGDATVDNSNGLIVDDGLAAFASSARQVDEHREQGATVLARSPRLVDVLGELGAQLVAQR
ncbi:MAG: hypothetical protein R2746_16665 [Acidimicrobiales bacterium]